MKKLILIFCISIFSLALFAQSPQNTNNTIKAVDISEDKTEKAPGHQTEEIKLKETEMTKEFAVSQEKIDGIEKEYNSKPSDALLKKLNKEKLNMKILRNKGRTALMEMKYKSKPSEGLLKEINEEKSRLQILEKDNKSNN